MSNPHFSNQLSTGTSGLDQVLGGGLPEGEVYLVQGGPGTGKTTLALQFLMAGGEDDASLFVSLSQTRRSLLLLLRSHGWELDDLQVVEMGDLLGEQAQRPQSVLLSSEVELDEMMEALQQLIHEHTPTRVVIDSIADLRVLASSPVRFRRELFNLRRFLHAEGCTALFLDEPPTRDDTREMENQSHGIFLLEQKAPSYGSVRRRLQVLKLRGQPFLTGYHNFSIETGGIQVYPRIKANGVADYAEWSVVESGIDELDEMLAGGLRAGTSCLIVGPTGSGKTSLGHQVALHAAQQGRNAVTFLFDERIKTFHMRSHRLAEDAEELLAQKRLHAEQINTGTITPSEFAYRVQQAVEQHEAQVVLIDSLTGYLNAMQEEKDLITQLHELLTYLSQHGVLTLLVVAQHASATGKQMDPTQLSYMADSVLLLRYNAHAGQLKRTISVLKQRHGAHLHEARELQLTEHGLQIGPRTEDHISMTLDPPIMATMYPSPSNGDHVPASP